MPCNVRTSGHSHRSKPPDERAIGALLRPQPQPSQLQAAGCLPRSTDVPAHANARPCMHACHRHRHRLSHHPRPPALDPCDPPDRAPKRPRPSAKEGRLSSLHTISPYEYRPCSSPALPRSHQPRLRLADDTVKSCSRTRFCAAKPALTIMCYSFHLRGSSPSTALAMYPANHSASFAGNRAIRVYGFPC